MCQILAFQSRCSLDVGQVRAPGKRKGKWLQYDYVNSLKDAGIPVRQNHGRQWRETVRRVAQWAAPRMPGSHWEGRIAEGSSSAVVKSRRAYKQSFAQKTEAAERTLQTSSQADSWLGLEVRLGVRCRTLEQLSACLNRKLGPEWYNHNDAETLEVLDDTEPWGNAMNDDVDFVLVSLVLQTCRATSERGDGKADRMGNGHWRLRGKQAAVNLTQTRADREVDDARAPVALPPRRVAGVRVAKSEANRFRMHESGRYQCSLCHRFFTTGRGLASHMELVHLEGTFRAAGFECPLCPRLFARQSAHTWHVQNDHAPQSTALICPHCKSVFPGMPIMVLHLKQDHEAET